MSAERHEFKQWAIVELFGHARIAGLLTEQTIGHVRDASTTIYAYGAVPTLVNCVWHVMRG